MLNGSDTNRMIVKGEIINLIKLATNNEVALYNNDPYKVLIKNMVCG